MRMFPMPGHRLQRIWTRFGMRPPYNLWTVMRGLFCRETARHLSTVGSFWMPHVEAAAAAAAAISLDQRAAATAVDRHTCRWADPGIPWCRHSSDNRCGISNDNVRVCGLWDAHPIVVVAQWPVDWRLAGGQLNTVCVCVYAGTPAQIHIACCRICNYASFQLSHCQPRCCSCCRFASVAPANSTGLTQQYFFVCKILGGTVNALTFSMTCCSHGQLLLSPVS